MPKLYGLIGYPLAHSLSPAMHNAAFKALKIDAEYKLFPLKEKELGSFLKHLRDNNIYGLNVTVPYKEKVIPFLDRISREAELIQAVNTIKVCSNRLEGFNTDGEGFLRHLTRDLRFDPRAKNIVIIGAGGAAKAISVYLSRCNPNKIHIYDINLSKAKALVRHLSKHFPDIDFSALRSLKEIKAIGKLDLLINATPIGLKPDDPSVVEESFLHKDMFVYDLIYNPAQTKLLKIARKKDARVSNGLGMLLYQGMLSFKLWTSQEAPFKVMHKALKEAIYK